MLVPSNAQTAFFYSDYKTDFYFESHLQTTLNSSHEGSREWFNIGVTNAT